MKEVDLILSADWHVRESIPTCRTDDFPATLWRKIKYVADLAEKHGCFVMLAGDVFHHWKPSPNLLRMCMEHFPFGVHAVYGQHDLPQHNWNLREKSGLAALEASRTVEILPTCSWGQEFEIDGQFIYSFEIGARKILVWHKMVWQGKRLWPGQEDPSAIALLKKYPEYDLILTGDNHKPFVEKHEGRLLVNPGSLTRQSAEQIDRTPRVYCYNAESNTVWPEYLPIENDAVSRLHLEERVERENRIEAFISKLEGEWDAGLSFEANLRRFLEANKVLDSTKAIIYKSMDTKS
jgi:DNA repair exonuclease SbcCD nuclease subunit